MDTTPYWTTSATFARYRKLGADLVTEVVVVGGGVTGLTAAYLMAKAGKQVVLLERDRAALADTGHTSAHLTMVTDTRLTTLVERMGRDHAQAVWDAGRAAIATIDDIAGELGIDAGFAWIDGYLHAPADGSGQAEVNLLKQDAALARELGFDADFVDAAPLVNRPGIRFAHQARVHPRAYLAGVAKAFVDLGGQIYEGSPAEDFCAEPRSVSVGGHTIRFDALVIATHNPLVGLTAVTRAALFQTKLALYTSYVIAGRASKGTVPDALFWDTSQPYYYLRVEPHRDFDLVVFGGEDHKTGQQEDTTGCYRRLEAALGRLVPGVQVEHRWSGQVIETPDGLPYIGQSAEHQWAATGYAGNGLTFGTLAGVMIADAVLARRNPWAELFDPGRLALSRGLWNYLKENVDYPYYMIRDRVAGPGSRPLRAIRRGHGAVIERDGAKVAASRDASGKLTLCSAICTHMGCTVAWNGAERTWDCPCHGSRFAPSGKVLSGPAETPLANVE